MTMDSGGPSGTDGGGGGCFAFGIFLIGIATVVITLIALV